MPAGTPVDCSLARHVLAAWIVSTTSSTGWAVTPFEVAKPEQIFTFYRERGFALEGLKTCAGGLRCNEFLFTRASID